MDDAISANTSIECPSSEINADDDNNATDSGRKPRS